MKNWKIYLIHHSHTDIGYTERQEKLMRYHRDFILQAVDILDKIDAGILKGDFKWQCENQWQIENYYMYANDKEKQSFEKHVKSGRIGLSGNYLNMTEMVDYDVLFSRLNKVKKYADKLGIEIKSGMSADVNGYAWGYTDALYENGVENLYCNLHPHHGMFPLYKKQQAFYWESPKGNKVLTWLSEHYHFGNELFFAPHAGSSYMLFDDNRDKIQRKGYLSFDENITEQQEIEVSVSRITRYLNNLETEDYPFDFAPFMVSGAITDNAPPSFLISKRVEKLNEIFKGKVIFEMATLDDFFNVVKQSQYEIPTYKGDFTDWWADGIGSTPHAVKLCRDAQRKVSITKKLDGDNKLGNIDWVESASENIMLYTEHTWGYSSSVSEPWDTFVSNLEKKKDAYAINANTEISKNLDLILSKLGEVSISIGRKQRYKILNPHDVQYKGIIKIYLEYWECIDGHIFDFNSKFEVYNELTNEKLFSQGHSIARAYEIEVFVDLKSKEEIIVYLKENNVNETTVRNHAHIGADAVRDIITDKDETEMPFIIETPFFKVKFSQEKGIESIFDKTYNKEIIDSNVKESAFGGIYEVTKSHSDDLQCDVRRRMGRNRCSMATERSITKLIDIEIKETGSVYSLAKLTYCLEGTNFYYLFLKVYKVLPLIEARICIHKKSVWDPENLYVSLPFITDGSNETYIDKTGCIIRPGIDQLPGACQDFYLLQNGFIRKGHTFDIVVAMKDAPLISFGQREAKPIELCDCKNTKLNTSTPYSWVMNNFWETNFKVDLGGFHEFTYFIKTVDTDKIENEIKQCEALNQGVLGFFI